MSPKNKSMLRLFAFVALAVAALAIWHEVRATPDAVLTLTDLPHGVEGTFRCRIITVAAKAVDYRLAPESAVYLSADCSRIFIDDFE